MEEKELLIQRLNNLVQTIHELKKEMNKYDKIYDWRSKPFKLLKRSEESPSVFYTIDLNTKELLQIEEPPGNFNPYGNFIRDTSGFYFLKENADFDEVCDILRRLNELHDLEQN